MGRAIRSRQRRGVRIRTASCQYAGRRSLRDICGGWRHSCGTWIRGRTRLRFASTGGRFKASVSLGQAGLLCVPRTLYLVRRLRASQGDSAIALNMISDHIKRLRKSTLARNAAWMFAGQGFSFVIQALYFVFLARLLNTTQYGVLAGAVALVAVVSQYSTMGSGLILLRYVSQDQERFSEY